jgi:hypothetical protein
MRKIMVMIGIMGCISIGGNAQNNSQSEVSLPVRISKMNLARPNEGTVLLNWQVICRLPFAFFQIQRSGDGRNFETIHSFQADYIRCQSPFDFFDRNIFQPYYYRIVVGDIDGQFTNEKILFSGDGKQTGELLVVNPIIGDIIWLRLHFNRHERVNLKLYNMNGVRLSEESLSLGQGQHLISFRSSIPLSKGKYFVHITTASMQRVIQVVRL